MDRVLWFPMSGYNRVSLPDQLLSVIWALHQRETKAPLIPTEITANSFFHSLSFSCSLSLSLSLS